MFKKSILNRTLNLCIGLLFALTLLLPVTALAADTDIIGFPDANLKQALLGMGLDANGDGGISQGELSSKTVLNLANKSIANLSGLEYAVNLKTLDVSFNKIYSISPLSGLVGLSSLYIQNNSITEISPVANMSGLVNFNCQNNKITDVTPVAGLTALTELNISGNTVTNALPLSNLVNLTALDVSGNGIQNMGALSGLKKLVRLYVNSMNLTDISFLTPLKNLVDLNLSYNNVSDISVVSVLTKLQSLRFYYNKVSNITAVSNLDNLQYLNMSHCLIEDILPLNSLKGIKSIVATYNNINTLSGSASLNCINSLKAKGVSVSYSPQNSYTVAFNSQGGSSVKSAKVQIYYTAKAPKNPTRTGYIFGGWFKEPACINAWNFSSDRVLGNVTLYAKWIGRTYTVTFDSRGGSAVSSQTTGYKGKITEPAKPVRAGYTFAGWYKDTKYKSKWKFSSDKVTKNIKLYAKWSSLKYTVKVSVNNAKYGSVKGAGTYENGKQATVKAAPKSGYVFIRWLEGPTAVSATPVYTFTVNGSRTLKAEFGKIKTPVISSARSAGFDRIQISWKSVPGASGYLVYRASSAKGKYRQIARVGEGLSFTNTGLKTGKSYYYKIKAYYTTGTVTTYGAYSNVKSAAAKAAAPVISAAQKSSSGILVSWSQVPGATKYVVYRASSKKGSYKKLTETAGAEYSNTGLAKGKTYYYKVKAYRKEGTKKIYSGDSNIASIKIK